MGRRQIIETSESEGETKEESKINENILLGKIAKILPPLDKNQVSLNTAMQLLIEELEVAKKDLLPWKQFIKKNVVELIYLCKGGQSDNECNEFKNESEPSLPSEVESDGKSFSDDHATQKKPPSKRKIARKKSKPEKKSKPAKKKKTTAPTTMDPRELSALKEACRAASIMSPLIYKKLKQCSGHEEQITYLTEKLFQKGFKFTGKYPSENEIANIKAEADKKKDLDGIDTSLIIDGRRRRGGALELSVYAESFLKEDGLPDGNDSESEASVASDFGSD